MRIVRKLGAQVNFGGDKFKGGQGAWDMVAFNEKRRWVFPLVQTACSYDKLNGYFGKLRNSQMGVLQTQGRFGENSAAGKVINAKSKNVKQNGKSKSIISDMEDTILNTPLRDVDTISGCPVG